MTMTKADIVERIYEQVGLSKKDATEVVERIFEILKQRLEQGQKVKISGFGNFVVHEKRPRKGRNPQTGEDIVISGRKVLTFKASQVLKKTMNPEAGNGEEVPVAAVAAADPERSVE
jgi:integration host factor subunit alpha